MTSDLWDEEVASRYDAATASMATEDALRGRSRMVAADQTATRRSVTASSYSNSSTSGM